MNLDLAAPQGPRGFPCSDECRCETIDTKISQSIVVDLYERLIFRGFPTESTVDATVVFVHRLFEALRKDTLVRPRSEILEELSNFSECTQLIRHIRTTFSNTWAVIQQRLSC